MKRIDTQAIRTQLDRHIVNGYEDRDKVKALYPTVYEFIDWLVVTMMALLNLIDEVVKISDDELKITGYTTLLTGRHVESVEDFTEEELAIQAKAIASAIVDFGTGAFDKASGAYMAGNEEVAEHSGYSEPGYDDPEPPASILVSNWNFVPNRIQRLLEKAGYKLEWSDEWTACSHCTGLVRITQDSYGWVRSYNEINGEVICNDCFRNNEPWIDELLDDVRGDPKKAITLDGVFVANDRGYVRFGGEDGQMETGYHRGQDDDPEVLAKSLKERGIEDFWFSIDGCGQFQTNWSCWIKKEDEEKAKGANCRLPYSIAEETGKALGGKPSKFRVETLSIRQEEFVKYGMTEAARLARERKARGESDAAGGIQYVNVGGEKGKEDQNDDEG